MEFEDNPTSFSFQTTELELYRPRPSLKYENEV
jgi:hypothetical protein